ncbi:SOUL heme-binding protein [Methanocorpusculum labreanum Z]|uniref:SOUL heme-binding protein n=1 Tax=Methanocorpusculum labreanum (strain ATCC 43576 / DSM 4855 / Z) TaxID=410358 RepID=A2SU42_METLZ|nr:heme-binding protein [Methanocorpusculum labreanum]ABN07848.1 SOUL heme-binding protein [Methanocorpusculum labreanum Z]
MTETIPYEVTGKEGEIEFRKYPALVLATVESAGDDSGFNLLFAYISGKNAAKDSLQMTAPVITSAKIPMTAPVVSNASTMSFVMPPGKTSGEIPEPLDSKVRIVPVPEREIAVIAFKGKTHDEEVKEVEGRLLKGLRDAGIEAAGEVFLMRYNPPWIPGFLRHNEVGVEVRR